MSYRYRLSSTLALGIFMVEDTNEKYPITSFRLASYNRRMVAFAIDDIVISLLFFIIFYEQFNQLFSAIGVIDEHTVEMINGFIAQNILAVLAIKLIYHTLFIWKMGMTLGKYVMKIKVIEMESETTPTIQKSLLRAMVRIVSETLFYLGFVLAFFIPLKQTLHDKLSGTIVIDV